MSNGRLISGHFSVQFNRSGVSKSEMIERIIRNYALEKPMYVGDTVGDEQAARSAKVDFGYVAYGFGEAESPTATFQSFGDLVAWFRKSSAA